MRTVEKLPKHEKDFRAPIISRAQNNPKIKANVFISLVKKMTIVKEEGTNVNVFGTLYRVVNREHEQNTI